MTISGIRGYQAALQATGAASATGAAKGVGFADSLARAMQGVEAAQQQRDVKVQEMVTGEIAEAHDVMVAAEEAQLAFEMMLEVRNRLLESYNSIMQMQV